MSTPDDVDGRGFLPEREEWQPADYDLAVTVAEQAVLGSVLRQPADLDRIRWLSPQDFHQPLHGQMYAVLQDMHRHGQPIDATLFVNRMRREGLLQDTTRRLAPYTLTMTDRAGVPGATPSYAREVLDASIRRELAAAGVRLEQFAAGPGDVSDLLDRAREQADALDRLGDRWEQAQPGAAEPAPLRAVPPPDPRFAPMPETPETAQVYEPPAPRVAELDLDIG